MGTTIDGVYYGGKNQRRRNALKRLEDQLKTGKKFDQTVLEQKDIQRINTEIQNLKKKL